jgi:hypothetical protein
MARSEIDFLIKQADCGRAHLAAIVHCVDDEIIEWLKRRKRLQVVAPSRLSCKRQTMITGSSTI